MYAFVNFKPAPFSVIRAESGKDTEFANEDALAASTVDRVHDVAFNFDEVNNYSVRIPPSSFGQKGTKVVSLVIAQANPENPDKVWNSPGTISRSLEVHFGSEVDWRGDLPSVRATNTKVTPAVASSTIFTRSLMVPRPPVYEQPVDGSDEELNLNQTFSATSDSISVYNYVVSMRQEDLESGRIEWSNVVAEIHGMPHGYSPDLEEGIQFYAPGSRERVRELFAACAEQGRPFDEELQIIDADGNPVWVRAVGRPVCDDEGRITRVHGAFQDVSEQHRMSERLRAYRQLIESSDDPFHMVDRHLRFTLVNQAYAGRHGLEVGEVEGRSVGSIIGREYFDEHLRQYYERCLAGAPQRIETRFEYPELGERHLQERYNPIATPDGEVTHVGVVISDITELKQAQHELMHSRDDLAKLLETRKALINSLPAHIAVLDRDGRIVDVNDQWRHFGRDNEFPDKDFGVGSNYIEICDGATGECAEEAAQVADGLRDVLAGDESLSLISLRNVGSEPVIREDRAAAADAAEGDASAQVPRVFRHRVELVVRGDYFAVLAYLKRLEGLDWQFQWDALELQSVDYPVAQAMVSLSTLSLAEDWIGV